MTGIDFDVVVVGAGFFGCEIALELKRIGVPSVALVDRADAILRRASSVNQARIHNGYHYPRAIVTAERSRKSFDRFVADYDYATHEMRSIYSVARGSKVSASQFEAFCRRLRAPCRDVTHSFGALFDNAMIEAVFETREIVFDVRKIAEKLEQRLRAARVSVQLSSPATLTEAGHRHVKLSLPHGSITTRHLINATYANLGGIGVPLRSKIRRELAEIVLIGAPPELHGMGVTIVDGPYFSVMPFPPAGCHSLTHVRYTPHHSGMENGDDRAQPQSHAASMIRDAARYLPCMSHARIERSLYEWKALPQQGEDNDARPILIETSGESRRVVSILGGKIDNVYDALDYVRSHSWSH